MKISIFHTAMLPAFYAIHPGFFPCLQLLQSKAIHCAAKAYNFCLPQLFIPEPMTPLESLLSRASPSGSHRAREAGLSLETSAEGFNSWHQVISNQRPDCRQISLSLYSLGLAGVLGTVEVPHRWEEWYCFSEKSFHQNKTKVCP